MGIVLIGLCLLAKASAWQSWSQIPDVAPFPRHGHSMVLNKDKIYIFGGRSNEVAREHIPKTYQIIDVNGTLKFSTYEKKFVREGLKLENCLKDIGNMTRSEALRKCGREILIGDYFNDIWEYDLTCERWADEECQDVRWVNVFPGAWRGGCDMKLGGAMVCTAPPERYGHAAAVYNSHNSTEMFVYGGYGQMCSDYCSDLWVWTFEWGSWAKVGELGPQEPGKRWAMALVQSATAMFIFGGQRLWHGFHPENSKDNVWEKRSAEFPTGGYMDDFWQFHFANRSFTPFRRLRTCFHAPGARWEQRDSIECIIHWPGGRSGATLAQRGHTLYLYGGFRTFFPYPHLNAPGVLGGTRPMQLFGDSPYPTHPYYLGDFWKYNMKTGYWSEIKPTSAVPLPRTGHSLVAAGPVLLLMGGYRSNLHYDELWQFNTSSQQWRQKKWYVHAEFGANCTDVSLADAVANGVFGNPTRATLLDGKEGRATQPVLIPQPRRKAPGWDGCRDRADGRTDLQAQLLVTDAQGGALHWMRPSQRSEHRTVYSEKYGIALTFGGLSFVRETGNNTDYKSEKSVVVGDMWQWNVNACPSNCSLHGFCLYGYCVCDNGFYGIDCSNSSCPGDFCYYDFTSLEQVCVHCCHAPHPHFDNDTYVTDQRKIPCSRDNIGESHGVCDGFGHCQCAPPYITDDCSVKDCPEDCAGAGWCSVEYPVSRCMCDPPRIGTNCSVITCLNNCTYPNGVCNTTTGQCQCAMTFNPYNRTVDWYPFMGEDCSFVVPFAAASTLSVHPMVMLLPLLLSLQLLWPSNQPLPLTPLSPPPPSPSPSPSHQRHPSSASRSPSLHSRPSHHQQQSHAHCTAIDRRGGGGGGGGSGALAAAPLLC